ncbi:TetR/AcrR family transcriptional regulator [Nocardiopsis chromatogenes]|uniref:TetR/AcrR family transcriptional regulator n=1 Tax=Nocardiopsis chromatogenes TaxID=280239 RepID=UPI0003758126|nr:TetR/AcrR family transcriptional regulator [Nocardiopsis chromatogenes]
MPKISAPTIAAHRAQTRERILEAVAELTRTAGIDDISMTEVAARAGITRTALYNYFPDKAALLLAFADEATAEFMERYRAELHGVPEPTDRLSAFVRLQLEAIAEHPHPPAAELGASLGPDAYQRLADHVEPMQQLLEEVLRHGTDEGAFAAQPVAATARLVLAMIGAQRVPILRGETSVAEAHTLVTAFTLRALGAAGSGPDRTDGANGANGATGDRP